MEDPLLWPYVRGFCCCWLFVLFCLFVALVVCGSGFEFRSLTSTRHCSKLRFHKPQRKTLNPIGISLHYQYRSNMFYVNFHYRLILYDKPCQKLSTVLHKAYIPLVWCTLSQSPWYNRHGWLGVKKSSFFFPIQSGINSIHCATIASHATQFLAVSFWMLLVWEFCRRPIRQFFLLLFSSSFSIRKRQAELMTTGCDLV